MYGGLFGGLAASSLSFGNFVQTQAQLLRRSISLGVGSVVLFDVVDDMEHAAQFQHTPIGFDELVCGIEFTSRRRSSNTMRGT